MAAHGPTNGLVAIEDERRFLFDTLLSPDRHELKIRTRMTFTSRRKEIASRFRVNESDEIVER
jgi:hypothetical protein